MSKTYLGDAVYVSVENAMIKLETIDGMDQNPTNVIYLESEVYENLLNWVKRVYL